MHVLVVDDHRELRETLALILRDEGYHVTTAGNGRQALALIEEQRPDLILTDLEMPLLDGEGLLQRLRDDAPGQAVVVMSGRGAALRAARTLAADAYLEKPFDVEMLLTTLARLRPAAAA
jgi:CheY-like chemotaxis protein